MEEGEISPSEPSTSPSPSSSDTGTECSLSKSPSPSTSNSETVPMDSQPINDGASNSFQEQQQSEQKQTKEDTHDLTQMIDHETELSDKQQNGTNGDVTNEPQAHTKEQQQAKSKREKKAKKKKKTFTDPTQIVESVLAKSNFKVANLSQIVEQKFYHAQDYRAEVSWQLSDIIYKTTVGATVDGYSDVDISVLPSGFDQSEVNLSASAIMNLPCMYEKTPSRKKMKGKRNQKQQQKAAVKNNSAKTGKQAENWKNTGNSAKSVSTKKEVQTEATLGANS